MYCMSNHPLYKLVKLKIHLNILSNIFIKEFLKVFAGWMGFLQTYILQVTVEQQT